MKVSLPRNFNTFTMYRFVSQVVDEQRDAKCSKVEFDFELLEFIEPVGVVVLSNLIEYFKLLRVRVHFSNHMQATRGVRFLDDAGFFRQYVGRQLFVHSQIRNTTMPLEQISGPRATSYLYQKLMPWIGQAVGHSDHAVSALRGPLEEIFHNVRDHSGVDFGCAFAQHFPNKNELQVAISDFGKGIPAVVRTRLPELLDDGEAIRVACREGFTTQSNVRNRGAGLPTLMRYVTQRNGGNVLIAAGRGNVSATSGTNGPHLTIRTSEFYPGTLVRVILRTDALARVAKDAELEPFEW